jgi:hypothetical protein
MLMAIDLVRYSETLQGWLGSEVKKYKSWEAFARAMASGVEDRYVSGQTLRNWARKLRKETLPYESILLIAAYRQETAKQTEAWLSGEVSDEVSGLTPAVANGGSDPSPDNRSIAELLREASPQELAEALEAIADRLKPQRRIKMVQGVDSAIASIVLYYIESLDMSREQFAERCGISNEEMGVVLDEITPISSRILDQIGRTLCQIEPEWGGSALTALEPQRVIIPSIRLGVEIPQVVDPDK